jgi:hypothetical protein
MIKKIWKENHLVNTKLELQNEAVYRHEASNQNLTTKNSDLDQITKKKPWDKSIKEYENNYYPKKFSIDIELLEMS